MAVQITIRGVSEDVRDELAARAASSRLSMQEYLRRELERIASRPSVARWLEDVAGAQGGRRDSRAELQHPRRAGRGPEVTVVVDASVMVAALMDSGPDGGWAESVVSAETLVAPELVLVEATSILRRLERREEISRIEANGARRDLLRRDIELLPFAPFADRVWELRHNVSSYDAWYVAVAEAFRCPLATLDRRLTRAVGVRCGFAVP